MIKKCFLLTTLILTLLTTTVLAAENEDTVAAYDYTSQTFGFKILCPAKPIVVVNPFEDPADRGELLVFANEGIKVLYGYQIKLDAFNDNAVPDFNKSKKKVIDSYIAQFKSNNAYESVDLVNITKDNKGVLAVTAKEIEVKDDNGEVEGVLYADSQSAILFFRTPEGRCVSIQLLTDELNEEYRDNYFKSVVSFKDEGYQKPGKSDKNSSNKKDKKKK